MEPSALESALIGIADGTQPSSEYVSVTVMFTCPVTDLEAAGFIAWTVIPSPDERPSVAAGPVPADRLRELAAVPGVRYIEGSRPQERELNVSVPEIGADILHDRTPGNKGKGVVVAVIDSGIDIFHRSFRNEDGSTRIRGIWDQSLPAPLSPGEAGPARFTRPPPAPPPPGVEYTQADVDATLKNRESGTPFPSGTKAVRTVDTDSQGNPDGHGTHVAGIAAGDGSQKGNCRPAGAFTGVAPAADILIVKRRSDVPRTAIGESTNLLNALDWIWNHPVVFGDPTSVEPMPPQPVVVNMSFGDNRGPHDGKSAVETALDLFLVTHPGHAAVKSAGNEGQTDRHAQFTVPAGGTHDVTFWVNQNEFQNTHMELWFPTENVITATLNGPVPPGGGARPVIGSAGRNVTTAPPLVANPAAPVPSQTSVVITNRAADPRNGAGVIELDFSTVGAVRLFAGEYQLRLQNASATDAKVDGYIDKGTPGMDFSSDVTRSGTISVPGTANLVATVGAYAPRRGVLFFKWDGELTSFSSFGPSRDGTRKPTVAAPGAKVTSVKIGTRQHCCCNCCFDFYTDETVDGHDYSGTSMAAPHVTGVIALMLEKNPALESTQILQILEDTANEPEVGHAPLPDNQWGAGRLNAVGAVDRVTAPTPIPGPIPLVGPAGPVGPATGEIERPLLGPVAFIPPQPDAAPPGAALLETLAGQHWYALVSRHFSEVRGLINSNRRVALGWHRMQGPDLVRLLGPALAGVGVLSIVDDPASLATWRPQVARFLDALEEFGSESLAADTRAHRDVLLSLDLDDIVELFAPASAA